MSTGGAAMKATMKQVVAASRVGIISTPNQPMYSRFSVLATQLQNCSHTEALSRLWIVVVMVLCIAFGYANQGLFFPVVNTIRNFIEFCKDY
jgi:hypothetical protein